MQRGLLSLLSNLNESYKPRPPYPHERQASQQEPPRKRQSSSREHPRDKESSFIPYLPTSKHSLEASTFATKYAFTTAGITPLTQTTKHGLVKITQEGQIELHLPSISHNTFTISHNSKHISVNDSRGVIWRGNVDELPWRWTRVYRYASRFVEICRSRIPQVSVEVDGLRGRVMLNGEFEAWNSREGVIVRISEDKKEVKIISVQGDCESIQWQGAIDDIPQVWREPLRSATSLYRKCVSLSREAVDADGTAVCVPGVGWCATRDKKIQLLFEDGIRMEVDLDGKRLVYCDARRRKERWRFGDEDLPMYIRERLRQSEVFRDVE
jgi:hypothetical protein